MAIGVGAERSVDAGVVVAAVLGVAVAAALWWLYFDVVALVAERRLSNAAPGRERNAIARDSFSYLHFPMVAGHRARRARPEEDARARGGPAEAGAGGGAARRARMYLLAHVAFRLAQRAPLQRAARWCAPPLLAALLPVALRAPGAGHAGDGRRRAGGADRLREPCASPSCATGCATSWPPSRRRLEPRPRAGAGRSGPRVDLLAERVRRESGGSGQSLRDRPARGSRPGGGEGAASASCGGIGSVDRVAAPERHLLVPVGEAHRVALGERVARVLGARSSRAAPCRAPPARSAGARSPPGSRGRNESRPP